MIKSPSISNEILLSDYYLFRFGDIKQSSTGDFLDNIEPKMNLVVSNGISSCGEIESEYLIVFSEFSNYQIYKNTVFSQIVNDVIERLPKDIQFPLDVMAGLACSSLTRDADGIVDHAPAFGEKIFESRDDDSISSYRESFFCIASYISDIDASFNRKTHLLKHEGEVLTNLNDLYGRLDEDNSWVTGVMKR